MDPGTQPRQNEGGRQQQVMEVLLKKRNGMEKHFQADRQVGAGAGGKKEKMMTEKERSELHRRENEAREAQTREEMEALLKERDEMRRRFQADKDSLMLQLEEERRNTEKEIERFDKRQKITEGCWRKHCEVVEQIILEEVTELEKMTKELNDLKEIVEELKQKARTMDPEMMRVGWLLKLCKRKTVLGERDGVLS
ncbi:trichohyalin-like [Tachysurus vachellii]|uniref:trichohyalin-like n=1 Tax=Tachysurus vachellii TaxID=175792 RepID=UPI00296AD550|nr:trichohyalin-like [Tachysurus vachellii]